MQIELTKKQYRRLLDLVYIGNWVLNSTRGTDRFSDYDEVEGLLFTKAPSVGMPELIDTWPGGACPSRAFVTGGIHEAVRICDAADPFGVKCMIGCMLESKVSVSAGVHLAAARSCVTMADLDGPSLCRIDPYEGGPVYEGPHIFLKEDNGIGITGVPVKFETI